WCRRSRWWYCLYFFVYMSVLIVIFFFSSRRRHTRSDRDWSSDVCSSDLGPLVVPVCARRLRVCAKRHGRPRRRQRSSGRASGARSEERRVGKEYITLRAANQPQKNIYNEET